MTQCICGCNIRFCPQVCRMLKNPISAPRCFGSAATSSNVFELAENRSSLQQGWVGPNQCIQLMRQRKHDVKITDVQQLLFSRFEPVLACLCLALGAVPIPAGVIRDGLVPATGT